jgi:pteridine reductase
MKTTLVTGGARRLGRAVSLALGRAGYSVAVHHRNRPGEAAGTAGEIAALGVLAAPFRADFDRPGSAAALVEEVLARFGRLDLLVHGASPFVGKDVAAVTEADWDGTFAAVARAAFFLAQASAPALERSGGSIVFVSDVAARKAWPHFVPHAAAKAALESLVRNLAVALGPAVRVNAVAPGIVLPPSDMPEEEVARLVARTPLKRRVAVEDVCDAVLFLARNGSITGHVLDVDAGGSLL